MGESSTYRCPNCGYSATVAGGRDCGFETVVETISSSDCRELYDAEAEEKARDVLMDDGRVRGNLTGIQCPVSEKHSFMRWRKPRSCLSSPSKNPEFALRHRSPEMMTGDTPTGGSAAKM